MVSAIYLVWASSVYAASLADTERNKWLVPNILMY